MQERQQRQRGQEAKSRRAQRHRRHGHHVVAGARNRIGRIECRLHPFEASALRQPQALLQYHRQRDGADQHPLPALAHQGSKDEPPRGDAVGQAGTDGEHQREQERGRHISAPTCDRKAQERRVAAHGCQLTEGEVDAADQAVDQRIPCRQQRIDGDRRQGEQHMLQADGNTAWNLGRHRSTGDRFRIDRCALRFEPEALEDLQPQLAERPGVGRHPDQRTSIRRHAAAAGEAAFDEAAARRAVRRQRAILDAHALGCVQRRRAPDFERGTGGIERRYDSAAGAGLASIDAASTACQRADQRGRGGRLEGGMHRRMLVS